MNEELRKGNVVVLKRPLADFLCVIVWVDGNDISVRYLDSPREAAYNVVTRDEIIRLSEEQERLLPSDFLSAVDRQRQIIFSPKRTQRSLQSILKGISDDQITSEIFRILSEDGATEGEHD